MELNEILLDLHILFQNVLSIEKVDLKMETTAKDLDGWDSLNHMTLIAAIEKKYQIKFALKEIMKLKNVEDMCKIIQAKVGGSTTK